MGPEVLSALSLPHAHPQLRKLKSNLVHPLPKMSALPPMLSAKKSPTRRDAKRSSTNTSPTLEDMLMLDLSDMFVKREADAEADAQYLGYGGLHHGLGYAGYAHPAPVAVALPAPVTKTIETPCTEVATEHCVDVPIVKEVVTPVETCHVVTKVTCTPAVHSIPKVTCEAGVTEIVEHPVLAHHGAYAYGR